MIAQKHLFQLPDNIHYLNGAYMSPLLASVEEVGIAAMRRKRDPSAIGVSAFFGEGADVWSAFSKVINCNPGQVAVIPSASYGLSAAVNNIPVDAGTHVIVVSGEFPSGFYAVSGWCKKQNKEVRVIEAPPIAPGRGERWMADTMEAITSDTAAVVMSSINWSDGTMFNLEKIGERCRQTGTLFIVDGTQSVGVQPIDVVKCHIDALVCAGYKWLLGPYSIGLAYYGEQFSNGVPLEGTWLNRTNAADFASLTQYTDEYKPGAARYNMGEYGNFISLPMLNRSLEQVLSWGVEAIHEYSVTLIQPLLQFLREKEYWVEEDAYRANHLFGFALPSHTNSAALLKQLQDKRIYVSLRGNSIRVSAHVYNTPGDIEALIQALK